MVKKAQDKAKKKSTTSKKRPAPSNDNVDTPPPKSKRPPPSDTPKAKKAKTPSQTPTKAKQPQQKAKGKKSKAKNNNQQSKKKKNPAPTTIPKLSVQDDAGDPLDRTVYIYGIPKTTSPQELYGEFSAYGTIRRIKVLDKKTNNPEVKITSAFILFAKKADAKTATSLDGNGGIKVSLHNKAKFAPGTSVIVSRLKKDFSRDYFLQLFPEKPTNITIKRAPDILDKENAFIIKKRQSKAILTFDSQETAKKALEKLHERSFEGAELVAEICNNNATAKAMWGKYWEPPEYTAEKKKIQDAIARKQHEEKVKEWKASQPTIMQRVQTPKATGRVGVPMGQAMMKLMDGVDTEGLADLEELVAREGEPLPKKRKKNKR